MLLLFDDQIGSENKMIIDFMIEGLRVNFLHISGRVSHLKIENNSQKNNWGKGIFLVTICTNFTFCLPSPYFFSNLSRRIFVNAIDSQPKGPEDC